MTMGTKVQIAPDEFSSDRLPLALMAAATSRPLTGFGEGLRRR